MEAQNLFANLRVNITAEGKIHLGGVIGSTKYGDKYVKDLVKVWDNQLTILPTIVKTQPQAAYLAFASGFKSKLYFLRTIPNIRRHLLLPVEGVIRSKFIYPSCNRCHICSNKERVRFELDVDVLHTLAKI